MADGRRGEGKGQDRVERHVEVDGVGGGGLIGFRIFWQICHFIQNLLNGLHTGPYRFRDLLLRPARQPEVEDPLVACLFRVFVYTGWVRYLHPQSLGWRHRWSSPETWGERDVMPPL